MKTANDLQDIRRIVIFRTDRIGEVLLATPIIQALKKNFPQASVTFATSEYAKGVIANRKDIKEIIVFDTISKQISFRSAFSLGRLLKEKDFDLAVVLNPHKMLHLAVFLGAIPYRLGFNRKWSFFLNYKTQDRRAEGRMHEVEYSLKLLNAIGIQDEGSVPTINIADDDTAYIKQLFKDLKIEIGKKIIAIHPGSSNPAKMWPAENYVDLIKRLNGSGKVVIILTGEAKEKPLCQKICSGLTSNSVYNLAGMFNLERLAALLKMADLMITNDNGPMHIAAAVDTKVIAIFGRNIAGAGPTRWAPYGGGHIIFYKDPGCSPCYDKDCPYDFKCLRNITPDEVFEAAKTALQMPK